MVKLPASGLALRRVRSHGDSSRSLYLTNTILDMAQASAAANRILSTRFRPKANVSKPFQVPSDSLGGATIELKDVHFKYPTRDIPVFKGLSLTVR